MEKRTMLKIHVRKLPQRLKTARILQMSVARVVQKEIS